MKVVAIALVSFLIVSCSKHNSATDLKTKVVGIIPYKGISKNEVDTIARAIKDFYHIKTIVLTEKELPKAAFVNIKSRRYRADSLIKIQN